MTDDLKWLNGIDEVDQETVEQEAIGYPWLQWVHGNPQLKQLGGVPYTGGWFLPQDAAGLDDDAEIEGWQRGTLTHADGNETDGWFTRDITVSMVRSRRAWHVRVNGQTTIFPWSEYDQAKAASQGGSLTGRTQILAVIKGLDTPRPVVVTVHGSVGKAFSMSRSGDTVLTRFTRCVITPANKLVAKSGRSGRYPYRAFWLTVGPARDDKGAPVFETVGEGAESSKVTLPTALGLHDKMTGQEIGALFVGSELLAETTVMWREAEEWATAWEHKIEAEPVTDDDNGDGAVYASEEEIPF